MKTNHTPGPWHLILEPDAFTILTEEKEYVATTHSVSGDEGGYQEEANAKLMAAAPKLLWAAEQADACMNLIKQCNPEYYSGSLHEDIKDAIKKATS